MDNSNANNNILLFAGSTRNQSYNKKLIYVAKKKLLEFERSAYNMENRSMFTLADYVFKSLGALAHCTSARRLTEEYQAKIEELEYLLENSGAAQAVYEAPIQTELTASVELDIRYLFYIKKYGAPENGIFDPVLLSELILLTLLRAGKYNH